MQNFQPGGASWLGKEQPRCDNVAQLAVRWSHVLEILKQEEIIGDYIFIAICNELCFIDY